MLPPTDMFLITKWPPPVHVPAFIVKNGIAMQRRIAAYQVLFGLDEGVAKVWYQSTIYTNSRMLLVSVVTPEFICYHEEHKLDGLVEFADIIQDTYGTFTFHTLAAHAATLRSTP